MNYSQISLCLPLNKFNYVSQFNFEPGKKSELFLFNSTAAHSSTFARFCLNQ